MDILLDAWPEPEPDSVMYISLYCIPTIMQVEIQNHMYTVFVQTTEKYCHRKLDF